MQNIDDSVLISVVDNDIRAISAVKETIKDANFKNCLNEINNCTGKILITGCGTSASVAHRGAHLLSVCGRPAFHLPAEDGLHGGLGVLSKNDIVIALSKGGNSKTLIDFCKKAKMLCSKIIVITQRANTPLNEIADIVMVVPFEDSCDLGGVVATGSSGAFGTFLDVLCEGCRILRNYTWEQLLYTHPSGDVGLNAQNTLKRLSK